SQAFILRSPEEAPTSQANQAIASITARATRTASTSPVKPLRDRVTVAYDDSIQSNKQTGNYATPKTFIQKICSSIKAILQPKVRFEARFDTFKGLLLRAYVVANPELKDNKGVSLTSKTNQQLVDYFSTEEYGNEMFVDRNVLSRFMTKHDSGFLMDYRLRDVNTAVDAAKELAKGLEWRTPPAQREVTSYASYD
ncbi:MAG: hypothetical protein EB051_03150, partial [Chlamydiia bacterium]|nr:hypothetical protein [Chlamydiia bacterium]